MPQIYRATAYDRKGRVLRSTLITGRTLGEARFNASRFAAECGAVRWELEG